MATGSPGGRGGTPSPTAVTRGEAGPLGQAAGDRRGRPELHLGVDVVVALAHRAGGRVRHAGLHGDAVTGGEVSDALADLRDGAGALMAEDHRRLDHEGADLAV